MKLDFCSFLLGGLIAFLVDDIAIVLFKFVFPKLNKKHTGGSFLESYNDNKGDDDEKRL